jgi:hypothetical protein
LAAILLAWFCLGRRQNLRARSSREFFDYDPRSPQLSNSKAVAGLPTLAHTPADHPHAPVSTQDSQSNLSESAQSGPTLAPLRRDRQYRVVNDTGSTVSQPIAGNRGLPPLPTGTSSTVMEQKSFLTLQPPSATQDAPPSPDIHLLAREVAAVMMQNRLDPRADDQVTAPPSYVNHH